MAIYIGLAFLLLYFIFVQRLLVVPTHHDLEQYGRKSKYLLLFAFCGLLALATNRGTAVGTDTAMYMRFFYARTYEEFELAVRSLYELAYQLSMYELVPISLAALFLYGMLRGIYKHCPNDAIGLLLFILTFVYFTSFNQMRQLVAAALLFGFVGLLMKRGFGKLQFALVIAIATLFHQSAIFLVFLLAVPRRRFHPALIAVLFIGATLCYFTPAVKDGIGGILSTTSNFYEEKYATETNDFFQVNKEKGLVEFLPVFMQMLFVFACCYYPKQQQHFFQLVTNLYVLYLTFYAFSGIEAIDRVQVYLGVFTIYFYAYFIHNLLNAQNKYLGKLMTAIVLLFWCGYYLMRLLNNNQGIVPYTL
ncbi:MAG: EpsG family protein [Solibacillus sp.]